MNGIQEIRYENYYNQLYFNTIRTELTLKESAFAIQW